MSYGTGDLDTTGAAGPRRNDRWRAAAMALAAALTAGVAACEPAPSGATGVSTADDVTPPEGSETIAGVFDCLSPLDCWDGDPCTKDLCTGDGACEHPAIEGCLSCEGRCGEAYDPDAACGCDAQCALFGDCCEDFAAICEPCTSDTDCADSVPCTEDLCFGEEGCAHLVVDDACLGLDPPDLSGTCEERCWSYDPEASCQCDEACDGAEDCCADFATQCTGSCQGLCELYHEEATCQCDTGCSDYGDCCDDYAFSCAPWGCDVDSECDDLDPCTSDTCAPGGYCAWDPVLGCESGAPEGTCDGRCGTYLPDASCQCDTDCAQFGDCCADMDSECPSCADASDCPDAGGECVAAACEGGMCTLAAVPGCLVVELPYGEPFECGSDTALGWELDASAGDARWAVDALPAEPEPAIGTCTLNAAGPFGLDCSSGETVSISARSPWIDATALAPAQQVVLFFAVAGGWAAPAELSLHVERDDGAEAALGVIPEPPVAAEGWVYYGVQAAPVEGFHVAGHKLRLRFDFQGDCGDQEVLGPFVDDIFVAPADCDDADPCTEDLADPFTGACAHFEAPECCQGDCGNGVCECGEATGCLGDCAECTEGACCDTSTGRVAPTGTSCGDDLLFVEDQCFLGGVMERVAFAGCNGQSSACSSSPADWVWSPWEPAGGCAMDETCVQTSSATVACQGPPVYAPGGCATGDPCCDTATGAWKPHGTLCDPEPLGQVAHCSGGDIRTRVRRRGCDAETGECVPWRPNWSEWVTIPCSGGCNDAGGAPECAGGPAACQGPCCDDDGLPALGGVICSSETLEQAWTCEDGAIRHRSRHPACSQKGVCGGEGWTSWSPWGAPVPCPDGQECVVTGGVAACQAPAPGCEGPCCGAGVVQGTKCGPPIGASQKLCVDSQVVERTLYPGCTGPGGECSEAAEHRVAEDEAVEDCAAQELACVAGGCASLGGVERNLIVNSVFVSGSVIDVVPPGGTITGTVNIFNLGSKDITAPFDVASGNSHGAVDVTPPADTQWLGAVQVKGPLPAGQNKFVDFKLQLGPVPESKYGTWTLWMVADPTKDNAPGFTTTASPGAIPESEDNWDNVGFAWYIVGECKAGACCDKYRLVDAGVQCDNTTVQQETACTADLTARRVRSLYQACTGAQEACVDSPAHLVPGEWKNTPCPADTKCVKPAGGVAYCEGSGALKADKLTVKINPGAKMCVVAGKGVQVQGTARNTGKAASKPFKHHFYFSPAETPTPHGSTWLVIDHPTGLKAGGTAKTELKPLQSPKGVPPGTWYVYYEVDKDGEAGTPDSTHLPIKVGECCDGKCCDTQTASHEPAGKVCGDKPEGVWRECTSDKKAYMEYKLERACSGKDATCPADKKYFVHKTYVQINHCYGEICEEGGQPGKADCVPYPCDPSKICCTKEGGFLPKDNVKVCATKYPSQCKNGKKESWAEDKFCGTKGNCLPFWKKKSGSQETTTGPGVCVEKTETVDGEVVKTADFEPMELELDCGKNFEAMEIDWPTTHTPSFKSFNVTVVKKNKGVGTVALKASVTCSGKSVQATQSPPNLKFESKKSLPGSLKKSGIEFDLKGVTEPGTCTVLFEVADTKGIAGIPPTCKVNFPLTGCAAGLCCEYKTWKPHSAGWRTADKSKYDKTCEWKIKCDGKSGEPKQKEPCSYKPPGSQQPPAVYPVPSAPGSVSR